MRQSAPHSRFNMIDVDWLCNVVEGPNSHRLNGVVYRLLAAHHYHDGISISFKNQRNELESADPGHVYVADYEIESLFIQHCQRSLRRLDCDALVFSRQ